MVARLPVRLELVPMPVSYSDFTSARDFFDAVRDAARDADHLTATLKSMEERGGLHAQGLGPRVRTSGQSDPMRSVDGRIDWEQRYLRRREEDYRLVDLACDVIYGRQDQVSGGVGALLSPRHADCLWWRFCAAAPWPEVARGCDMSERWCREAVPVALDMVDAYGLSRVASGLGLAAG